jgi:putative oxidoreductase
MPMLTAPSPRQTSVGLAILRVALGGAFAAHGAQKVFVYGIAGVTGAFASMGAPMPAVTAPLVAAIELLGGVAIILGLLTRPVALALVADMMGAILLVKLKGGYFAPDGAEYEILLCGAALALFFTGAGAFSLDQTLLDRRR